MVDSKAERDALKNSHTVDAASFDKSQKPISSRSRFAVTVGPQIKNASRDIEKIRGFWSNSQAKLAKCILAQELAHTALEQTGAAAWNSLKGVTAASKLANDEYLLASDAAKRGVAAGSDSDMKLYWIVLLTLQKAAEESLQTASEIQANIIRQAEINLANALETVTHAKGAQIVDGFELGEATEVLGGLQSEYDTAVENAQALGKLV